MIDATYRVPEVHCDHCKSSIEGAVGALDGVAAVEVKIGERQVDVSFDESTLAGDTIIAAIEEQGYQVAE
ncbi:MAG: copper ion binding protein [Acidimicrobiia bacterium]|nr:copper ion binding protein [Acidimicrobiia bacterium]